LNGQKASLSDLHIVIFFAMAHHGDQSSQEMGLDGGFYRPGVAKASMGKAQAQIDCRLLLDGLVDTLISLPHQCQRCRVVFHAVEASSRTWSASFGRLGHNRLL